MFNITSTNTGYITCQIVIALYIQVIFLCMKYALLCIFFNVYIVLSPIGTFLGTPKAGFTNVGQRYMYLIGFGK